MLPTLRCNHNIISLHEALSLFNGAIPALMALPDVTLSWTINDDLTALVFSFIPPKKLGPLAFVCSRFAAIFKLQCLLSNVCFQFFFQTFGRCFCNVISRCLLLIIR